MAWLSSTPCADIAVTLANSWASFFHEDATQTALNQKLRNKLFGSLWNYEQKCWIDAANGLRPDKLVQSPWPSCSSMCDAQASGTAQPDFIKQLNIGGSIYQFQEETAQRRRGPHDCSIYHSFDILGDSSDQDMLDLRLDVELEYLKILGLENSPVLQSRMDATMDVHPGSTDLNQVSLHSPGLYA